MRHCPLPQLLAPFRPALSTLSSCLQFSSTWTKSQSSTSRRSHILGSAGPMAVPSERDIKVRPPAVRGNPPTPLLSSFPTPDRPAPHVASFRNYADPPTPAVPPEGSPPAETSGVDPGEELQAHRPVPTEEVPAPSLDRAQEAWDKANTIQKSLEAEIPDMKPPPPDMANYGAQRLAQVSEMSRRISDSYSELFQSRADAKHQLFEHVYDEADTLLHDGRVRQQLARVLALIKHLLGPEAQAQSVLNGIWRTYMHSAMLHSYTIACASLELRPQQCPLRSATSGLPKAAEELKQLSRSQQEDLWALVETVFNMTVPLAPVRPPVVHWDPRLRPDGVLVRGESVDGGSALWANGTGEPRPDLWVVHPGLVTGSAQDLGLAQMLQRANIRRYLALQVWQLDDHAADWGVILETEDVRPTHSHGHIGHYLRSMRVSGRRAQAKRAGDAAQGAPGEMSVGDLLASLLRARLASMDADERWIKDEDV